MSARKRRNTDTVSAAVYVYMLACENGALYTGLTRNLDQRLCAHVAGRGARYTRSFPPIALVYLELLEGLAQAFAREAMIKKMSPHGKKKLIHVQAGKLPQVEFHSLPYCPDLVLSARGSN